MPTKRALLIGIDEYAYVRRLKGCVNDVRLMQCVLSDAFGFATEHTTVLLNDQATRAGILAALDDLISVTGRDDIVVVYYAGHGSRMTDREGDEPSGFDSTLMPVDTARAPGENRDITDDEIHLKLEALASRTPYTTVVVDACHSGTITRDAFGEEVRAVEADRRPISELPASTIPHGPSQATRSGASGWMPAEHTYVLIAGCRDDEESKEYRPAEGGGPHGALTYFLCQQLRQATPGTTYRDVFEAVAAQVNAYNKVQHPQMEGQAEREVFGVVDRVPASYVPVAERAGSTVILSAGAAHGVTVGSTYRICPPGTKDPTTGASLADVEITAVRPFAADARITREDPAGVVVPGARAFESAHAFGDTRLAVQIAAAAAPGAEALTRAVQQSGRLRLVTEATDAIARIYLLPRRTEVSSSTPVPQAGALAVPKWAVVGATGDLLMKLKDVGDETTVVQNLEKIARYRQVLAIENPDPRSRLRGKVSFELLRRGSGQSVAPETDGGLVVFAEEEKVTLRITNHHDGHVYIALVVVELDGAVNVVELDPSHEKRLAPNEMFEINGDLPFPEGYPFVDLADDLRGAEGIETFKVFVTEQNVDFRGLAQSGLRSAGGASSALAALLQDTVTGTGMRSFRPEPVATDDWTTVSRSFVLRRTQASLTGSVHTVALGQATVSAPGLSGIVSTGRDAHGRDLSAGLLTDALQRAFDATRVQTRQAIEVAGAQVTSTRGAEEPSVTLRLLSPPEDSGQMVLAVDELGVMSWHFATGAEDTRSAGPVGRTYVIPGAVPDGAGGSGEPASRGLIGLVGKKVFKELVFPLIDPVLGAVSASLVSRLEKQRFPYRVRTFTPDDYASDQAATIDRDGWSRLGSGRALLMVHGTFSRSHLAFGQLPKAYVEELHRIYEGRVFAFDHFTLSEDPKKNVQWLVSQMPDDLALDIDVVCHSRGGLVGRLLNEKRSDLPLGERLHVGKVVLVGVPNAGTALADAEHVGTVLDVFTNLMNFLPDNGVTDVMTMIVEVAKMLAVGAIGGLDGLQAMRPDGDFENWLNAGARSGDAKYFAVASNVTPTEPGLRHLAVSRGLNALLKGANDFVVPADGVFGGNGSGFFPVEERLVLEGPGATTHTRYFSDPRVRDQMLRWLTAR